MIAIKSFGEFIKSVVLPSIVESINDVKDVKHVITKEENKKLNDYFIELNGSCHEYFDYTGKTVEHAAKDYSDGNGFEKENAKTMLDVIFSNN